MRVRQVGDVTPDDAYVVVSVRLPRWMLDTMKRAARRHQRTLGGEIRAACSRWCEIEEGIQIRARELIDGQPE